MRRLLALAFGLFTLGCGCLLQARAQFFVPGPALWAPGGAPTCAQKWSATQINSGLSGGGTVTVTQGGTAQEANAFAAQNFTTGKYYVEFQFSGEASDGNTAIGIGNTSSVTTTGSYLGEGFDTLAVFLASHPQLFVNNTAQVTFSNITWATTDRTALAIDLTDSLIWFKDVTAASSWYGSSGVTTGDPVAGTNGFSLTQTGYTITSHPVIPAVTLFTASSSATGEFGSGTWAGTAPTGYGQMCS